MSEQQKAAGQPIHLVINPGDPLHTLLMSAFSLPNAAQKVQEGWEDVSIQTLNLPARVHNSLYRASIRTVAKLLERTGEELLHIPNFGQKALDEVIETLDRRGLSLRKE